MVVAAGFSLTASVFQSLQHHPCDLSFATEQVEVGLVPTPPQALLRPASIFRTAAEVAEADRLHSDVEKARGEEKEEWHVARTVKHTASGMEFEVRFGFNFSLNMHQLNLRLRRSSIEHVPVGLEHEVDINERTGSCYLLIELQPMFIQVLFL
jgi:hypothetical protein